jgi:hypothetical protein
LKIFILQLEVPLGKRRAFPFIFLLLSEVLQRDLNPGCTACGRPALTWLRLALTSPSLVFILAKLLIVSTLL